MMSGVRDAQVWLGLQKTFYWLQASHCYSEAMDVSNIPAPTFSKALVQQYRTHLLKAGL